MEKPVTFYGGPKDGEVFVVPEPLKMRKICFPCPPQVQWDPNKPSPPLAKLELPHHMTYKRQLLEWLNGHREWAYVFEGYDR